MNNEDFKAKMDKCENPADYFNLMTEQMNALSSEKEKQAKKRYASYSENIKVFEEYAKSYLVKDTLKVMDEAIPLLLGVIPSDWNILRQYFNYGHKSLALIESDQYGSLEVINGDKRKGLWRVKTKDFFKWADDKGLLKSKGLIEAIKNTKGLSNPKRVAKGSKLHGNTENNALAREEVFKSALAVMKHFPEQCISERKKEVTASQVANVIDEKAPLWWPEEGKPPLARATIEKLIQSAFKLPV